MRLLTLLGIAVVLCTGCHCANRGGPAGFGMLGSSSNNGVASAPPVYATPPQYVQTQQVAPIAAAPQVVAAPSPQPIIVQAAPVAAPAQVIQQPQQVIQPAAYYQSNACQPCQPICEPVCCQPCQ